ncbi:MAG: hypothetical protein N2439_05440 [Anaerolineae bacterium]|nr:hypothetical protein [Anaerolineae bacterium]
MTEVVVVRDPALVVHVGMPGIPGPPGPSGAPAAGYRHHQAAPSAAWVVNHNLGRRVVLSAHGPGGALMLAHVLHTSDDQAIVYFDQPVTGYAICS